MKIKSFIPFALGIVSLVAGTLLGGELFSTISSFALMNNAPISSLKGNGNLTDIGVHKRPLTGNSLLRMPSGDVFCKGDVLLYVYQDSCSKDSSSYAYDGVELDESKSFVFKHKDKSYTVKYNGCKTTSSEIGGVTTTSDYGCTVSVETSRLPGIKQSVTKEITLGAGMKVLHEAHPDLSVVKTIDPLLNESPLLALVNESGLGGSSGFDTVWKSPLCGAVQYCTMLPDNSPISDGESDISEGVLPRIERRGVVVKNGVFGIATPRGQAMFEFSPKELYEKRTKVVTLDGATVSFGIKRTYYEKCEYSGCYTTPNSRNGELSNRMQVVISYDEK